MDRTFVDEKSGAQHVEQPDVENRNVSSLAENSEVRWTLKTIVATASLCGIWTGMPIQHLPQSRW